MACENTAKRLTYDAQFGGPTVWRYAGPNRLSAITIPGQWATRLYEQIF
jgi:hypothetical protein